MEIISIIPARGRSKGIPLKNITLLQNKPLLYYTVKAAKNSRLITRTIVSTDDKKIAKIARKLNVEVIKRPKRLSNDNVPIEPTMKHVLDYLKRTESYKPEVVVLLQNTSPLRTAKHIDEALDLFFKKKIDSVLSGFISHYFIWKKKNNLIHPINYNPKKRLNRQEIKDWFLENGAIYITKYRSFMKSNCRVSGKIGIYEMSYNNSMQIDTKTDLKLCNELLKTNFE